MGAEIEQESFTDAERARFSEKLKRSLQALDELVHRPGFGRGVASIGAELELCLTDAEGMALARNGDVLAAARSDRVTLELDNFNLECNAKPVALAGMPFAALEADLKSEVAEVERAAAKIGGRIIAVGTLPTLQASDLEGGLSDRPRYRALSQGLRATRQAPFVAHIEGEETLDLQANDVAMCGAATSFQVHLRVEPADFARVFNAAQLAVTPALAASGNSPFFLGKRLWHETRVALFTQGTDDRHPDRAWRQLPRVGFGHGWVREGITELFAADVALHAPLLPQCSDEDPLAVVRAGGVPELAELRLHHGTIYPWNRPVYDSADGGHLRVEFRPLPAGPTLVDMMANAAFLLGLTLGLSRNIDALVAAMPFGHAERSFFRAAHGGLGAQLFWPSAAPPSPVLTSPQALIDLLLPTAADGLRQGGVDEGETTRLLQIFSARATSGQTGAVWQRKATERLERSLPRAQALQVMLKQYAAHAKTGEPVHTWPLP
jgi:hypothetical protein